MKTEDRLATIQGYQFMKAERRNKLLSGRTKSGGGLGIYFKSNLHIDTRRHEDESKSNRDTEMQWVVVIRPNTRNILIGNIYRLPNGNRNEGIAQISEAMSQITNKDKYELLILGDFNVDYNGKKQVPGGIMIQFATEHRLQQTIHQSTRVPITTDKTIDIAFTNIKHCTKAGVTNNNISDHKPIHILQKIFQK